MLKQNMQEALNNQIHREIESAYLYFAMSAYFDSINLSGFAHWMRVQHQEEWSHVMQIYKFIYERGGRVSLKTIKEPHFEFGSALEAFQKTYDHECYITSEINKIMDLALQENDHVTKILLNQLIAEQIEEESTVNQIVEKLKMIGDKGQSLIMMDQVLGSREQ